MCSKAGGVKTTSGKAIAEWIMLNRKALNLKYVIWGQKIWNPSRDSVKSWSKWRPMEDRGSITQNHWYASFSLLTSELELTRYRDHVHVSFN
ncbi:13361_t:CDS:2, partial [Acaulospora colombiana]